MAMIFRLDVGRATAHPIRFVGPTPDSFSFGSGWVRRLPFPTFSSLGPPQSLGWGLGHDIKKKVK